MKFCLDSNVEVRIDAEGVGKDRDGNIITLYMHVHRDGQVRHRGQCPHPDCVVKDVIES